MCPQPRTPFEAVESTLPQSWTLHSRGSYLCVYAVCWIFIYQIYKEKLLVASHNRNDENSSTIIEVPIQIWPKGCRKLPRNPRLRQRHLPLQHYFFFCTAPIHIPTTTTL